MNGGEGTYNRILKLKDSRIDLQAETRKNMKKLTKALDESDITADVTGMKEWHAIQDRDENVRREMVRLEKIHAGELKRVEKRFAGLDDS